LEHQPLRYSRVTFFVLRQQLASSARQVQQDSAGFEYGEIAIAAVNDGWNASLGQIARNSRSFLIAGAQVNLVDIIRQPYFFQVDGHFPTVGRRGGVEVDSR